MREAECYASYSILIFYFHAGLLSLIISVDASRNERYKTGGPAPLYVSTEQPFYTTT